MSKLYTRYLELKREDPNKMYLIKAGLFYIFIGEDATTMSNMTKLKCVPLNDRVMKCGFPESAKTKYLRRLKENGKEVEVIDLKEDKKMDPAFASQLDCLLALESLDLNTITPIQAIEYLSSIQRELLRMKAEEEEKKEKVF